LYQGLQAALAPFADTYYELHQGAGWLRDMAYILEPSPSKVLMFLVTLSLPEGDSAFFTEGQRWRCR